MQWPSSMHTVFHQHPLEIAMNRPHQAATRLIAALILSTTGAAHAQSSWDAVGDFKLTANPNGPWSYSWQMPGGPLTLMPYSEVNCGGSGTACWNRYSGEFHLPEVAINTTGASFDFSSGVFPAAVLDLHPGAEGERSVVTWTAPVTGTYKITGQFQVIDREPTGTRVLVTHGGTTLLDKPLSVFGGTALFQFKRKVVAGGQVSFSVDPAGNYANDSTALKAAILKLQ